MFKMVTLADFARIEGEKFPQFFIDDELIRLGGNDWDGFGFKVHIFNALGYDVNKPPSDQIRMQVYNQIATALNELGGNASVSTLCAKLGIQA